MASVVLTQTIEMVGDPPLVQAEPGRELLLAVIKLFAMAVMTKLPL
jgi:hypothetical protein